LVVAGSKIQEDQLTQIFTPSAPPDSTMLENNNKTVRRTTSAKKLSIHTPQVGMLSNASKAEEGIIHSIMRKPMLIADLQVAQVRPEYFTSKKLRACYEASMRLFGEDPANPSIDPTTLHIALDTTGQFGTGEGQVSMSDLMHLDSHPEATPLHIKRYIKSVKEEYDRMEFARAAAGAALAATDKTIPLDQTLDNIVTLVRESQSRRESGGQYSDFFGYNESFDSFEDVGSNTQTISRRERGLPSWGISRIDGDENNGTMPFTMMSWGSISTFLSRTGGGKSLILTQIAISTIRHGGHFLMGISELRATEMRYRILTTMTGIPVIKMQYDVVTGGKILSNDEREKLEQWRAVMMGEEVKINGQLEKWPGRLDFIEVSGKSGEEFVMQCMLKNETIKLRPDYGRKGYCAFALDYIQDLEPNKAVAKTATDAGKIAGNMRSLSKLAQRTDTPVIVVSQVNLEKCRKVEDPARDGRFLYYPTYDSPLDSRAPAVKAQNVYGFTMSGDEQSINMEVLKATFGRIGGTMDLNFNGARYRIS
jgi:replicative DNA helicase